MTLAGKGTDGVEPMSFFVPKSHVTDHSDSIYVWPWTDESPASVLDYCDFFLLGLIWVKTNWSKEIEYILLCSLLHVWTEGKLLCPLWTLSVPTFCSSCSLCSFPGHEGCWRSENSFSSLQVAGGVHQRVLTSPPAVPALPGTFRALCLKPDPKKPGNIALPNLARLDMRGMMKLVPNFSHFWQCS